MYVEKITSIQHTFITSYAISSLPFCCLGKKVGRNNIMFKPSMLGDSLYRQPGTSAESYLPESSHTAPVHGFGAILTFYLSLRGAQRDFGHSVISTEFY